MVSRLLRLLVLLINTTYIHTYIYVSLSISPPISLVISNKNGIIDYLFIDQSINKFSQYLQHTCWTHITSSPVYCLRGWLINISPWLCYYCTIDTYKRISIVVFGWAN